MKKVVWVLVSLAVLYIIYTRLFPYLGKDSGCRIHHEVYLQAIKSTVEKRFIDSTEHNYKTIVYLNENRLDREMIFTADFGEMYDFLNVGDSIIKEKNSIYYRVKSKATGKDTVFKLETSCKDSLLKKR